MWPEGFRCAVAFTFDFDAETMWISDNARNSDMPVVLSQGRFAPRVAIPLILALLGRYGVKVTFFVPGKVAQEYPGSVQAIVAAGHELGVHGYEHLSPAQLDAIEEENRLVRTRGILESFGVKVSGYRAPQWEFSGRTLSLLDRHQFAYSSNMMDDIRPYRHPGTEVIELPVHWMLDDAAHFYFDRENWEKKIATISEVRHIWEAELLGIHDLGGSFILTMHPQIIGRPSRLQMLDEFIGFVESLDSVWIATCGEIAERSRQMLGSSH